MEQKTKNNNEKEKMINEKTGSGRPPIVVVLGHIDHGKTSLLDYIRKTNVTGQESGGITQHIGAYEVQYQGKKITFIDTPGHEAFSAMRSRGAKVADIAILVIAADEGVKPQTKEAISDIKKANIPFVVALSKIDKPEAHPEKVKRQLAENDILVESMGGDIPSVQTSIKTGKGINELLDLIELLAELTGLKENLSGKGKGVVIESRLDPQKGPLVTLLIKDGILKKGDIVATPSTLGKIRYLENCQKEQLDKAFPSQPVLALGFNKLPQVGEIFQSFDNLSEAKNFIQSPSLNKFPLKETTQSDLNKEKQIKLNLIIKIDVLGSQEAIENTLNKIPQQKVKLNIINIKVGDVSESDIKLAESSKSLIIGFRVKVSPNITELARQKKIKILNFDILYNMIEGIQHAMEACLKPKIIQEETGQMKTLIIFKTDKDRQIIGGKVIKGYLKKGLLVNVLRNNEKIGQGKIISLQKNKKNIEEGRKGEEVGILYKGNVKVKEDDILTFYFKKVEKESLS